MCVSICVQYSDVFHGASQQKLTQLELESSKNKTYPGLIPYAAKCSPLFQKFSHVWESSKQSRGNDCTQ